MRVLIACEYSGRVRDAFIRNGHDAMSCDLLPTDRPGPHYEGNVFKLLKHESFDLMVMHPPCTYLANSGARWLYKPGTLEKLPERWLNMRYGAHFFSELWEADVPRIAAENPIMLKVARELIGIDRPTQIIQPWQFGDGETKATCLWLKNLPPRSVPRILWMVGSKPCISHPQDHFAGSFGRLPIRE